jgi:hypothetical protein
MFIKLRFNLGYRRHLPMLNAALARSKYQPFYNAAALLKSDPAALGAVTELLSDEVANFGPLAAFSRSLNRSHVDLDDKFFYLDMNLPVTIKGYLALSDYLSSYDPHRGDERDLALPTPNRVFDLVQAAIDQVVFDILEQDELVAILDHDYVTFKVRYEAEDEMDDE